MIRVWLAASVLGVAGHALAISNIESERMSLPKQGLSGDAKLSLRGKTGNQQEYFQEAEARGVLRSGDSLYMVLLDTQYGEKRHKKNNDNQFAHLRWTQLLEGPWASEVFAQWQSDEFDHLSLRALTGGGGRYQWVQKEEQLDVAFGVGAFYEQETLDLKTHRQSSYLERLNTYYSFKYRLNDQMNLVNSTYVQPAFSDADNYRVLFDATLSVKLTQKLRLNVVYRYHYNSHPAVNLLASPAINDFKTNTEYKTLLAYLF